MSYETILNTAIRPPRNEFSPEELGPKRFELEGRQYERTDYTVGESGRCACIQTLCPERYVSLHCRCASLISALDTQPSTLLAK